MFSVSYTSQYSRNIQIERKIVQFRWNTTSCLEQNHDCSQLVHFFGKRDSCPLVVVYGRRINPLLSKKSEHFHSQFFCPQCCSFTHICTSPKLLFFCWPVLYHNLLNMSPKLCTPFSFDSCFLEEKKITIVIILKISVYGVLQYLLVWMNFISAEMCCGCEWDDSDKLFFWEGKT